MTIFLQKTPYINFTHPLIAEKASELFAGINDAVQKACIAYEFVRDEIPHSFDIGATAVAVKASDVLEYGTGICHTKSNLLAALLRSRGIPAGFCFQHLTLADDDSQGYCIHCYNAVFIDGRWIKLDARGNKPGVNARFSLGEPVLAYSCRAQYDEYNWPGIYAQPDAQTMKMLEEADSLECAMAHLPERIPGEPDILE